MNIGHTDSRRSLFERLIGFIERKPSSDRLLLRLLFFVVIGTGIYWALSVNDRYLFETPLSGGTLVEGVIGTPRFVNPVLAITRADQDMTALLYSGLMKVSPEGTLVPDLAESVTVSDDGRTYTITVRQDARFHDGTPLTARDVAFTIALIQDPDLKSPLRGNWSDVTVAEVNEYELTVTLEEPYAPFIENFTVGILPRHVWADLPTEQLPFSQLNTEPVGSGPFMIGEVARNKSGLIDAYDLVAFPDAVPAPKLDHVVVRFFQNEEALAAAFAAGDITSTASLPTDTLASLGDDASVVTTPLPRTFGVFFNQNRSTLLRDDGARQALNAAIDRQAIVDTVLDGVGVPITGPVPEAFGALESGNASPTPEIADPTAAARTILVDAGWEEQDDGTWEKEIDEVPYTLAVTLRTANTSLFEETANAVADAWRAVGVLVNVEQYEQSDLLQAVIRPRDFEALLFGTDLSRAIDLYPFWHSSQKDDPGLNIAQYTNLEADALLETARSSADPAARASSTAALDRIIRTELPALFLFSPSLSYAVKREVTTVPIHRISRPQERFMNVSLWYANSGTLWPWFQDFQ